VAVLLWILSGLFLLRVAGQILVVFFDVAWLPPVDRWQSGLLPYPVLLAWQIGILALMLKVCVDYTRRDGWFFHFKKFLATKWLAFGYLYLGVMLARAIFVWDRPIPIFFHWVLAAFVIVVGHSHRRRIA
jgi:hypothetical protein